MHDLPDTEDQDAASERYWPEGYKNVLTDLLYHEVRQRILEAGAFKNLQETRYSKVFPDHQGFADRLAQMVVIGAENGADEMFEEIYASFRADRPLPADRALARYFWPLPFSAEVAEALRQILINEYGGHHAFHHIHEDHYAGSLSFEDFIKTVADLVVCGAQNGADQTLGRIYQAFVSHAPLPPSRRRPRLLR
jgi:hypothetical protein